MRIVPDDRPIELSYLDLCRGLSEDIRSDDAMPDPVRQNCLRRVETLLEILEKYSA